MSSHGNVKSLKRGFGLFVCVAVLGSVLMSGTMASAASLFWGTVFIKTGNLGACLNLGKIAMTRQGLTAVRLTSLEVTGVAADAYAVVICLSSQKGVHAVIMVSSDTDAARTVRDGLHSEISRFAMRYQGESGPDRD